MLLLDQFEVAMYYLTCTVREHDVEVPRCVSAVHARSVLQLPVGENGTKERHVTIVSYASSRKVPT